MSIACAWSLGHKVCGRFRHAVPCSHLCVFGRMNRGRHHPADHMWRLSKTLVRASTGAFHHRAACTGPGGLAVQQHQRDRLSTLGLHVLFVESCVRASVFMYLCVCTICPDTCMGSWVHICIHLSIGICVPMTKIPWGRLFLYLCAVCMVMRVPLESMAGLWFMERLPSCPLANRGGSYSAIDHLH